MDGIIENNKVTLSGEIVSNFEFSHEVLRKGLYVAYIKSERASGNNDVLPIMVSERLVAVKEDWIGQRIRVRGQFRSYNNHENGKSRLILFVFVSDIEILYAVGGDMRKDENEIFLDGYVCKSPIYRKTPLGREIADVLIAVNRPCGKSDYIPCVAWRRNARFAKKLKVGERCSIYGRIQSRKYVKKISDGELESKIAYEVSVSRIELTGEC